MLSGDDKPPSQKRRKQTQRSVSGFKELETKCVTSLCEMSYALRKSYLITYLGVDKRQRKHTLRDPPPKNETQALIRVKEIDERLSQGIDPAGAAKILNRLFDEDYKDAQRCKRSLKDDVSRYDCHLRSQFEGKRPADITPAALQRIVSGLKPVRNDKVALTTATRNRVIALLKRFFRLLTIWGYLKNNPATSLKLEQERNQRRRVLRNDEIRRFFKVLETYPPTFRNLLVILLMTGVRKSEALECKWKNIDTEKQVMTLELTKNGRAREVPLPKKACEAFEEQRGLNANNKKPTGPDDYVFTNKSGENHMTNPSKQFKKLCEEACLPGLWMHDLRRTFGSIAAHNNVTIQEIGKILGHSDVRVTERYIVNYDEKLLQASQSVDDYTNALLNEETNK